MTQGTEQFRRAITTFRNIDIVAALNPLMVLRTELISNDEFMDRGGSDDPTRAHYINHLRNCDKIRRRITHNPEDVEIGVLLADSADTKKELRSDSAPFAGDNVQTASGGLIDLPWALDGTDPDIPVMSQLKFRNGNGLIILGAIDRTIVNWTRLNSRDRTKKITAYDSLRMLGQYQECLNYCEAFLGDENRVDVAQVLPSDEPLGPEDSPNRRAETSGGTSGGTA